MRSRPLTFLLLLFACTIACRAQAAIHVTSCELIASPEKYSGKVVQVRARVNLVFEDFSLAQEGCEDAYPGVWLVYGGDEPTPTSSTVNDLSRKPGSVLKVNGRPIPLVHDDALELFRDRLNAIRISPIGDHPCYDCHLYRVTATLTGVFFAAINDARQLNGYGHLGCCHLLAIQQVSDVDAKRTPIPMGGSFQCESENRSLDALHADRLKVFDKTCVGLTFRQCQDLSFQEFAAAAKYWNDHIEPDEGTLDVGEIVGNTSKQTWESADKLKTYTLSIQSDDPTKIGSKATGGVITREICKATVLPLPMSTAVICRRLWSEFPARKEDVESMSRHVAAGEQPWRMSTAVIASKQALRDASENWGIALAKDFLPAECEKPMVVGGDQFTWCGWTARDGMQSLSIQITRFGYLRKGGSWTSVPWFLTRGSGVVCSVAP
jgi:hypothetical protein